MVEKGALSPEKSTIPNGPSCVARNRSGFSTIYGNLLRPLELIPASRGRVVLLQNGMYAQFLEIANQEQKVIPSSSASTSATCANQRLPGHFAHQSLQEEATLATNWIKDPREG